MQARGNVHLPRRAKVTQRSTDAVCMAQAPIVNRPYVHAEQSPAPCCWVLQIVGTLQLDQRCLGLDSVLKIWPLQLACRDDATWCRDDAFL